MRGFLSGLLALLLACVHQAAWANRVVAPRVKPVPQGIGLPAGGLNWSPQATPVLLPGLALPAPGVSGAGVPLRFEREGGLPAPAVEPVVDDIGPAVPGTSSPLEVLKQAENVSVEAVKAADQPELGYHANTAVFDHRAFAPCPPTPFPMAAGDGALPGTELAAPDVAAPDVDASGARPEAGVPTALEWLGRLSRSLDLSAIKADPLHFRKLLVQAFDSMTKGPVSEPLLKAKAAYSRGDAATIARSQNLVRDRLLSAARRHVASKGLDPASVISNGTTLDKLLGMAFTGGLEATSSYQGMSGESAHFWGVRGVEGGAGYGTSRSTARRRPGVLILIHNETEPIKVVQGETLGRQPLVGKDFLAAVVSDGVNTVVLDAAFLRALADSALQWKEFVKTQAYKHDRMGPFLDWQAWGEKLKP
ncbi:MAG: hypothetical protein HY748_09005 [Elusimicrobia bacterium]|nr:hypothetical protein [Elusimicrobiota bacterium]